jgi:anthranilate synthase component 2
MNVVLIDNYDSFTWNVVHALGKLGARVVVYRNDAVTADEVLAQQPDAVVISPGPCTPREAGISLDLIAKAQGDMPILGICLGHQAIGEAYGGRVVRGPVPMHGKLSTVRHGGRGLFRGINGSFEATRYHSLIVDRASLPAELDITADTADGIVMGVSHREHPVHGVQFHPESIACEQGATVLKNFLELAAAFQAARGGTAPVLAAE